MTDQFVETLKAMADPLRLRIISVLGREELAVGELAEVLGISQPRVSHHVKMLRESNLIQVRREGSWTICRLTSSVSMDYGDQPGEDEPNLLNAIEPWTGSLELEPADLIKLERILEARRERSRAFFDAAAEEWEHLEPGLEGNGLRHQALSSLLPDDLVLADIGCGTGFMTKALATRARRVILIDHSPVMLEKAKIELGDLEADLEFRVGELDAIPLDDNEVDGAFVNLVLHHVPDLKATLRELYRTIVPGGSLVISDLLPHSEEWLREEHADLRLGLEPGQLCDLARETGFSQTRVEPGADLLKMRSKSGAEALLPLFVLNATRERVEEK